jgi:hypothetical protein
MIYYQLVFTTYITRVEVGYPCYVSEPMLKIFAEYTFSHSNNFSLQYSSKPKTFSSQESLDSCIADFTFSIIDSRNCLSETSAGIGNAVRSLPLCKPIFLIMLVSRLILTFFKLKASYEKTSFASYV